jgi:hypothetical protein
VYDSNRKGVNANGVLWVKYSNDVVENVECYFLSRAEQNSSVLLLESTKDPWPVKYQRSSPELKLDTY